MCGAFAVALGVLILLGWLLDITLLIRVAPDLPLAMPNSALCFIACGAALVILARPERGRAALAGAMVAALFTIVLAALTLIEHAADVDLGIDTRLGGDFGELPHPGRPATHTAAAFLLLGCCLLIARWRSSAGNWVAGVLGAGSAATVGLAVAGYLTGVEYLRGTTSAHGMSVHTAVGLIVVLTGVFGLRPEAPPAAWYARSGAGEAAARRLMPPALVLPFLAGALAQGGASLGLYSERFGVSLLVILFAATIQGLIFLAVRAVHRHEAARERLTGQVVSRIAEAVSIFGPDGRQVHSNEAGRAILDDLRERFESRPLAEVAWGAIDVDGRPIPNEHLPAELTRRTGEAVDERVIGIPGRAGDVRWLRVSTRTMSDEGPPYTVVASYSDITAEREAGARLAEAQRRFELAFDHAPIGVCLVSLRGRFLRVNRALCETFGYEPDELLASSFQELTEDDSLPGDLKQLQRVIDGEIPSYTTENRYAHKDGTLIWALLSISVVRDGDDRPLYFIGQIIDVTERRRLERQLRYLADHDTLTGLANRRAFGEELGRQLARERRYGGQCSLLLIDLDGFKDVNDTFGHGVGDEVLRAVGGLLSERVRETDLAARLGGDEFAVLMPSTAPEGAQVVAIDLIQAIRELRVDAGEGRTTGVTASVGVANSAELPPQHDEDTLLVAADIAMYEAKRSGRDRYSVS